MLSSTDKDLTLLRNFNKVRISLCVYKCTLKVLLKASGQVSYP